MVARLRTNVLKREEKGIGPISFPRILLSGLAAVFCVLGLGRALGFGAGCISGVVVLVVVLFVTQPVSGTPMGQFLSKVFQGMVIVSARKAEEEDRSAPLADLLVNAMSLTTEDGILNCDEVFDVPEEDDDSLEDMPGLVFFRDISDVDSRGLQVISNPFNEGVGGSADSGLEPQPATK